MLLATERNQEIACPIRNINERCLPILTQNWIHESVMGRCMRVQSIYSITLSSVIHSEKHTQTLYLNIFFIIMTWIFEFLFQFITFGKPGWKCLSLACRKQRM